MVSKRALVVTITILILALILAVALVAYLLTNHKTKDVETHTSWGTIRGRVLKSAQGDDIHTYLGVPYAEPPVGQLRFADPQPKIYPHKATVDAFDHGYMCPQAADNNLPADDLMNELGFPEEERNEDCLTLSIWVPASPLRKNRTVLVWIHGGGFEIGSGSLRDYDGKTLASHGDVIVININYRLGMLGFFSTPDGSVTGNFGLKDQQLALQWIHDNVASFGGNASDITIMGESAGAASVGYHVLLPGSKGLFKRAILASGSPTAFWAVNSEQQQQQAFDDFSKRVGCTDTSIEKSVQCIKNLNTDTLVDENKWKPTVDGSFLPEHPYILAQKNINLEGGMLLGCTEDEGSLFVYGAFPAYNGQTPEMFEQSIQQLYPVPKTAVHDFYTKDWHPHSISDVIGDSWIICPTTSFADQIAESLADGKGDGNAYFYHLTHRASNSMFPEWMGVTHAADIQWYFGIPLHDSGDYTEEDVTFSKQFMDIFLNFAKNGQPTPDEPRLDVPSYAINKDVLELGGPNNITITKGPVRKDYCEFWYNLLS